MARKKKNNFWQQLEKPIFALAPMADVTDDAFRQMFARYGKPDVMFTEFVSTDGLCSVGRKNLLRELQYTESQRPIVAQIWGRDPKHYYETAKLIAKLKFDGIDINMGCPQKKEIAQKTCAALILEPKLAQEIVLATKRGAGHLPVSVKTRLGFDKIETERWLTDLLAVEPAAVTLHARTKKEMSEVPAHWGEINKAVKLRDRLGSKTLILGNGDIKSYAEGLRRIKETGADGVMVGRGAFGNPWFFTGKTLPDIPLQTKLEVLQEHAKLFEKNFKPRKNFATMKKHFKAYVSGFEGAAEIRAELMQVKSASEVASIVKKVLAKK